MKICFPSHKINYDWVSLFQSYKKYVNKSSIVLEIGASTVERTKQLSSLCDKVIGIEYFLERKPADFGNIEYLVGDWQNLAQVIRPASIDIAISSHVIEHIPDDLKALKELYDVLKPGGVALINTPNRKRLVRAIVELFSGERQFPFWEHVREYTEEDLVSLITSSNFKRFTIIPLVVGIHGGPIYIYFEKVPIGLKRYANFWEVHLFK